MLARTSEDLRYAVVSAMHAEPEFSGIKGRVAAWFLTSPLRRILHWRMGNPDARFMELLDLSGSEIVVDSGCGSGHHALMVAEKLSGGRVIGVDVSREMLAKLRENAARRGLAGRVEALEADALAIPLDDAMADRAISLATWHHLSDPRAACLELARILRPGGRLVCVDLEIQPGTRPVKPVRGHDRAFTAADMRAHLDAAGLEGAHVEHIGRWLLGTATKPSAPRPEG